MKSYVYLHGFASSPASSKARFFEQRLRERGVQLTIPELDGGDFQRLTLSGQLAVIDQTVAGEPVILLGSSMGGYLAALYAERHPEVERLVLLAPAFDFRDRWAARLGDEQMEQWRERGSLPVFHHGAGAERELAFDLFDDAGQYPSYPDVRQPALVLQGLYDDVVLPEVARRFCEGRPNATLHLFRSDHQLTDVLPELWTVAEPFLFS